MKHIFHKEIEILNHSKTISITFNKHIGYKPLLAKSSLSGFTLKGFGYYFNLRWYNNY